MNKANNFHPCLQFHFKKRKAVAFHLYTVLLGCCFGIQTPVYSQSNMNADGNSHRINTNGNQYSDYKIPTNTNGYNAITFRLEGADGGRRRVPGLCLAKGGAGATVTVKFDIGNQAGQLKTGGTIRFIPGYNGSSNTGNGIEAGGGGGGTGILYHAPNANITCSVPSLNLSDASSCWVLLGVAGGGGGAYTSGLCGGVNGKGGNSGTNGTDGTGAFGGHGGTNGNGGGNEGAGGGGGYLSDGDGDDSAGGGLKGSFTGGLGGFGSQDGDFGYGGGGGSDRGGGGGGGFSGGGSGDLYNAGGGGGSFANSSATYSNKKSGGTESTPDDGYVDYIFGVGSTTPVAVCKNITVAVDANGNGVYYATDLDDGSYDPNGDPIIFKICGLDCYDSIEVNCNDTWGIGSIPLLVNDGHENGICYSNVQLEDNIAPVVTCKSSFTVTLDATGHATIVADDLIASASDNCGIDTKTLSKSTFDCSNKGNNTVTVTVADADVNAASCTATVIVKDYTFSCKPDFNVTVPSGSCQVFVDLSAPNFSSGCGYTIKSRVCKSDQTNCTAIDATNKSGNYPPGNYLVQWLLYNAGGTTITGCFTYFNVLPNADKPTALCKNVPVQLDATGHVTIIPAMVDNGSSDHCGPVTESLNISSFDCSKVGNNTVTLTVTNSMGNTKTCTSVVTVMDLVAPTAICKNKTLQLNASGQATLLPSDINNGSSDACGILSTTLNKTSFNCSNVGANTVILTVRDVNLNAGTCTATVTVQDQIAPSALCKNKTVSLNAAGQGSIVSADINNGSTDACGIASLSLSKSSFNCSNVGLNTVTLSVTDVNGNTGSCTATVTVEDKVAPAALCQGATLNLSANGHATLLPHTLNNGSSDACGIQTLAVSPNLFTCNELGPNTVVLTVTDPNSNIATCSATVTVKDVTPPMADCKNITVSIDNTGFCTISPSDVAGVNIFEACGALPNMEIDISEFTCIDLGQRTVTLTLTDNSENSSSCTSTVTVHDVAPPQMHCKPNPVIVELDANGTGFKTVEGVDDGSFDNCSGSAQGGNLFLTMNGGTYTCADLGDNLVTLTGTDESNNSSTCTATIRVVDHVAPTAHCNNMTVYLDDDGNGSTTVAEVDNNSVDACGVQTVTLDNSTFHCSDLGDNTVVLTVMDYHDNSSTCNATVSVVDAIAPTTICQTYTAYLDNAGAANITTEDVFQSGSDNCGTVNQVSVLPNAFNCDNIGANTVTLMVNDGHGNTNTCTATVTVADAIAPTVTCKAYTANLNAAGSASVTTGNVYQSGSDNCGTVNQVSISPDAFNCDNIGANTVTLTVNDGHGNTNTCTATVTVADAIAPTVTCKAYTANLDNAGSASITTEDVFQSGSGNCGTVNQVSVLPNAFNCDNLGANTVTLTVNDGHGNTNTCSAVVTVADITKPAITCPNAITVTCASQIPAVNLAAVTSTDNCSPPTKSHVNDATSNQTCANRKTVTRTYRATDGAANSATCSQVITVYDNVKPNFSSVPANVTVQCNSVPTVGVATATDGCGGTVTVAYNGQTTESGACSDAYTIIRQWTATDACGNTKTATQRITVVDTQKPNFTTTPANITVQCNAIPAVTTPTATDNCDATVAITYNGQTQTNGACPNAYTLTRTWTAADNCGNTKTISQRITVVDNGKPVFTTFPGNTSIACHETPPAVGNPTASDGCGSATVTYLGQTSVSGNCPGNYLIKRTWRAADACGNSTVATQTIQVSDSGAPAFTSVPGPLTIECSDPLPPLVNPTASDGCGGYLHITFLGNVPSGSGCAADYTVTRTWEAEDLCGNTSTAVQVIAVLGNSYGEEDAENRAQDAGQSQIRRQQGSPLQANVRVQPNPTTDRIWIDLSGYAKETVTVSIHSDLGQLVWVQRIPPVEDLNLSVSLREAGAAAGIYTVRVRSASGAAATRVVLVE